MGGVDAIIFTAGIGENSDTIRAKVIEGLEFMGEHRRSGFEQYPRRRSIYQPPILTSKSTRHTDERRSNACT